MKGAATSALVRLNSIWKTKKIQLKTKIALLRAKVTATALYGCETWTKNIGFLHEMHQKNSPHPMERQKNKLVSETRAKKEKVGNTMTVLNMVKERKLKWFGHLARWNGSLANTIMTEMEEGTRARGRPKRQSMVGLTVVVSMTCREWQKTGRDGGL